MSIQQGPTPGGSSAKKSINDLAPNRVQIAYGLMAVGLALLAIPIVAWVKYHNEAMPVIVWGSLLSLLSLGIGVAYSALNPPTPEIEKEADRLRTMLLLIAGGAGLLTALLGLFLPFSSPQYQDVFSGGPEKWRQNGWMLVRVAAALLGGLFLIFFGLQLARTWERHSTSMRRLLYGYNAIFTSILLLLILFLINVLAYAPVKPFTLFAQTGDWTKSRLYSLSDSSKNFLSELQEPVKIYALLRGADRMTPEVETLMNNCRAINPRITWVMLSPDRNEEEVVKLMNQYQVSDPSGLLVLYGTEPHITHEFIKRSDLYSVPRQEMMRPGEQSDRFIFKGEGALMGALRYLAEGKTRANVYFTQGHGELEYSGGNLFQQRQATWSISQLRSMLEKRNYQTHPLKIDPELKQIPEDADILVIAGPTIKWPDNGIKALRDYLQGVGRKKPGKAMICLGLVGQGAAMEQIGIEPVLAEFNVRVGNERLLAVQPMVRPPCVMLIALTNPASTNSVARAFIRGGRSPTAFYLQDARAVQPAADNPAAAGRWSVETLLVALGDQGVIGEANLQAVPIDVVRDLLRNPRQLNARLGNMPQPVSLGIAVSEASSNMPRDMAHAGLNRGGEPRLIVIGDARWISDPEIQTRTGSNHVDLFASGLSWLRGRSDIGSGPEDTDKERVVYQPTIPPGGENRIRYLPGFLLVLVIMMIGMGVWVVRRR